MADIEFVTVEFEALLKKENLVSEPSVGKEQTAGWRWWLGRLALAVLAGLVAILVGFVGTGVYIVWENHKMMDRASEIHIVKVEEENGLSD